MKKFIQSSAIALLVISAPTLNAQVNNGDFSEAKKAPTGFSKIHWSNGWSNANGGTADFYHKNSKECKKMGTTSNKTGGQEAYKGDGYAGIITYYNDKSVDLLSSARSMEVMEGDGYGKYSEYITTKLAAPLNAGQTYEFTFYASLADLSGYAQSGLGAFFSKDPIEQESNAFMPQTPQVVSNSAVTSKSDWTKISGKFKATGGEQYVAIGVFGGPQSPQKVDGGEGISGRRAYYYIDGVSIKKAGKDSDGDGIMDDEDECPTVKGTINGCPDSDGDGVADIHDHCPNTPGFAEHNGCTLSDEELEQIKQASEHIFFNSGSAKLKEESFKDLDNLAEILKRHPEIRVRIEGHTDNTGDANMNLKLSKERAKAVEDYLVSHGEPADHISSEGYGETRPIADNGTADGRAKNRRVMVVTSIFKLKK